jgi:hypothetical protein
MNESSFIPIQNHRQNYSFVYLSFCNFRYQAGSQKIWNGMIASIPQI